MDDSLVDKQGFPVQAGDIIAYYDQKTMRKSEYYLTLTPIVKLAATEGGRHRVWITNLDSGWRILHPSEFVLVPSVEEMEWIS